MRDINVKKYLIISVVILALICAGFLGFRVNNSTTRIDEQNNVVDKIKEKSQEDEREVGISDWAHYKNEKYGFELLFPGDLKKLNVFEKKVDSDNRIELSFNYELDKSIEKGSGVLNDKIHSMTLWYLVISPVGSLSTNVCENKEDHCYHGEILGKDDKYLFSEGQMSIEGAGYLCHHDDGSQKGFCQVYYDFFDLTLNNELGFNTI